MSIKIQIQQRGYTLAHVAAALGISQQALSQQLARNAIPVRRLQDIAAVVGCTAADLLADDDDQTAAAGPGNFAALVSYHGRNYTPATVEQLQQLADRLAADQTAAGPDATTTTPPTAPPRRRRIPGATSDT